VSAARYRALMIGVAEYADAKIDPLPFVTQDLATLRIALEARGFEVEEALGPHVLRSNLMRSVVNLIKSARPGDRLLIVLSAHGLHADGVDYLLPSDTDLGYPDLEDLLVKVDWNKHIENCQAESVLIVVDACRDGLDTRDSKAAGRPDRWGSHKRSVVAKQKVAYLYACGPGARAFYAAGSDGASFSLFSRALREVAEDAAMFFRLDEVEQELQRRLDGLTGKYDKPRQEVRLSGETDKAAFDVFPEVDRSGNAAPGGHADPWRMAAGNTELWRLVERGPRAEELREAAVTLASGLSRGRRGVSLETGDVWHDAQLPVRTADRLLWLITKKLGRDLDLSPAEASLLTVAPFLRETVRLEIAEQELPTGAPVSWLDGSSDGAARFVEFARGYPRLLRRLDSARLKGDDAAVEAVTRWLYWQYVDRTCRRDTQRVLEIVGNSIAKAEEAATVGSLRADLRDEVFTPARLAALVLAQGGKPESHSPNMPAWLDRNSPREQHIRERLLTDLLVLAAHLAVDPAALGEVVPDHLGIGQSVDLGELRKTLAACRWDSQGRSLVLQAQCMHPAVEIALKEHVVKVRTVLDSIHARASDSVHTAQLGNLPTHANADGVVPADLEDGPAYDSAGMRFGIAEDRVQELLMGEQLYRDRFLAIRELYQNSLDACRYRRARLEYLAKTAPGADNEAECWRGAIDFVQGIDANGRAYLDCIDNGVGMGFWELDKLFAQSGVRFTDSPEYIREESEWARVQPPVELYPNSRFGIGVLSYFMIADEIVVTTCRMRRDGGLEDRLEVVISGPGTLFKVNRLGPGEVTGTKVRLYLNTAGREISCVDVLTRLLWVAEFDTSAAYEGSTRRWNAGELSQVAPIGSDPMSDFRSRRASEFLPEYDNVWWCDGTGAVLADGLWAGKELSGAVVNLCGRESPRLTVDRRAILDYWDSGVESRLRAAVEPLRAFFGSERAQECSPSSIGGYIWLCSVSAEFPNLGDLLLDEMSRSAVHSWRFASVTIRAADFGCFAGDFLEFDLSELFDAGHAGRYQKQLDERLSYYSGMEGVVAWRVGAYLSRVFRSIRPAGDPVLPAPSDMELLGDMNGRTVTRWGLIAAAARVGWPLARAGSRLQTLGYVVPDTGALPEVAATAEYADLVRALGAGALGAADIADGVSRGLVVLAASVLRWTVQDTAERLHAFGFSVPDMTDAPEIPLSSADGVLIGDEGPWLEAPDVEVPRIQLIRAAARLQWTVRAVADRLESFGCAVADVSDLEEARLAPPDAVLVRWQGPTADWTSGSRRWTESEQEVPLVRMTRAAVELGRSAADVAERLSALGFTPATVPERLRSSFSAEDRKLVLDAESIGLDATGRLELDSLVGLALARAESIPDIGLRLRELGFETPDTTRASSRPVTQRDISILNRLGGEFADRETVSRSGLIRGTADAGETVSVLSARLSDLGYDVAAGAGLPDELTGLDVDLLIDEGPWTADHEEEIPLAHLIRSAASRSLSVPDVAARYRRLGFVPADVAGCLSIPLDAQDASLVECQGPWRSYGDRGNPVWLGCESTMTNSQLLFNAAIAECSPAVAASRLESLGFTLVDMAEPFSQPLLPTDVELLGVGAKRPDRRFGRPDLNALYDARVEIYDLLGAALSQRRDLADLNDRLVELGLERIELPDSMSPGALSPQSDQPWEYHLPNRMGVLSSALRRLDDRDRA